MSLVSPYRPNWRSAVSSPLRVGDSTWDIHATPLPSSGPLLVHMLNVLEGYNMTSRDVGDIYHQVTTLHRVVETFKHAHGARPLLGDPDFEHVKKVRGSQP
uniref:Uncharacterized protein n=1 Tax=Timema tahoe TaxID=61484 RepID=A0A7R9IMI5_9NEOP|nr:unnamed protein product [Timema tahoe]